MIATLVVAFVAGCGGGATGSPGPKPPRPSGAPVAAAELVFFEAAGGMRPAPPALLAEPADVADYAEWFDGSSYGLSTAGELTRHGEFRDTVYLAFTARAGCDEPVDAHLLRIGSDLTVDLVIDRSPHHTECVAPFGAVAVFGLPRDELPADVTLNGQPPSEDVGPTP